MENVKKIWDKIKLNSFYEAKSSDTFVMYDENKANQITEEGKKNLTAIHESLKNENLSNTSERSND